MSQVTTAAEFLGVEPGALDSIALNVVDHIVAKAQEIEQVRGDDAAAILSRDAEITRLREEASQLNFQLQQTKDANSSLTQSCEGFKELANSRAEQIRQLEAAKLASQRELESASEEKRTLVESFEQRLSENRQLRSELDVATRCTSETRRANTELELSTVRLSAELATAQSGQQKYKITAERNQSTIDWLQDELKRLRSEYTEFRQSMLDQLQEKTAQLDTTEATYRGIRQSHEILKGYYNEKSLRLDESISTLQRLRGELSSERSAFETEMSAQLRVAAVLQETVDQCQSRIRELETELDAERAAAEKRVTTLQTKMAATRTETSLLQEKLHSAEEQLSQVYETSANGTLPDLDQSRFANVSNGGGLSPSASILSEFRRSGGSIVDLNASYQRAKREAGQWKRRYEHLRNDMDQVLEELQTNAPLLEQQQEEHARLRQDFVEFSERYDGAVRKEKEALEQIKVLERKLKDQATERGLMTRQVADLSRQLQHVLINSQLGADGEPLMTAEEQRALAEVLDAETDEAEAGEDTNRLISQRLVLFRDIAELQIQNSSLLKSCRALGQQMERQEAEVKAKYDKIETETVAQATVALETVQQKLETTRAELELAERDRDMFRALTKTGETGGLLAAQTELSVKLEAVRTEFAEFQAQAAQKLATAESRAADAERAQRELDVQLARALAQAEFVTERQKSAEEDLQLARSEYKQLAERAAFIKDSESRQEQRLQMAQQELVSVRAELETARTEAARLRAEHDMWARTEADLVAAREAAQAEAAQLRGVIAKAEMRDDERDTASADAHKRLLQQIDQLQSTVAQLNRKLSSAEDQLKLVSHRREKEFEAHSARELELSNQMASFREQLALAQLAKEPLELKVNELTSRLSAAEKRAELRSAKQTATAEQQVEEMVSVVQASEEALAELQRKYTALEQTHADAIAAKETEMARITEELAAAESEIAELRSQSAKIVELEAAVASKETVTQQLSQDLEAARQEISAAQNAQQAAASQALAEAQRSLQLADVISSLEARVTELDEQLAQGRQVLETTQAEQERREEAWAGEQREQAARVRETQAKLDDVIPKYKALQAKFDEFVDQAETAMATDGSAGTDGSSKIIAFLRERNELAAQSLQVAQEEAQDLRSRLSRSEAELASAQFAADQFRTQLEHLQAVEINPAVSAEDLEAANARTAAAEQQLAATVAERDELSTKVAESRKEFKTIQETLVTVQAEVDARAERIRQLEADNERWSARSAEAESEAKAAREGLARLKVEAQSKLDMSRQDRNKLREEVASLRASLEAKTAEVEQLKAAPAPMETAPVEPAEPAESVKTTEPLESKELQLALDEKEARIEKLETEINKVSDELVEAQAEAQAAEEKCQSLAKELADVQEELKRSSAVPAAAPAAPSGDDAVKNMLETEAPPSEELNNLRAVLVQKAGEEPVAQYTEQVERSTKASLKTRTNQYVRKQRETLMQNFESDLQAKLEAQRKEVQEFVESKARMRQNLLTARAEKLERTNRELSLTVRKLKGGMTDVNVETLPSGVTVAVDSAPKMIKAPDGLPQVQRPHVNRGNRSFKRGQQDQSGSNTKKRKEDM